VVVAGLDGIAHAITATEGDDAAARPAVSAEASTGSALTTEACGTADTARASDATPA
jgi:hypothetical protein